MLPEATALPSNRANLSSNSAAFPRGDYSIPTRLRMIHSTVRSKTIGTNHQ